MKLLRGFLLAALTVSALAVSNDASARYEGDFNLFVGQRWLQQSDWAPVDDQQQLGLMLAFGDERFPVHFAIDVFSSKDEADFVDPVLGPGRKKGSTVEYAFGVRKNWVMRAARTHLGGGATVLSAHRDVATASGLAKRDDLGYGGWVDGGVTWRLATHLNLGFEVRYSLVDVDLGTRTVPDDVPAGGLQAGLLLGYGW